jgi:hypothetical protein
MLEVTVIGRSKFMLDATVIGQSIHCPGGSQTCCPNMLLIESEGVADKLHLLPHHDASRKANTP